MAAGFLRGRDVDAVSIKDMSQDKGQQACAALFVQAIQQGKPTPIPADEIFEVLRVSVQIAQHLRG